MALQVKSSVKSKTLTNKRLKSDKEPNTDETTKEISYIETEKQLHASQISALNKKIARLKTLADEYQTKYENSQKEYEKLDEERVDIIAYLNKNLKTRNEECKELTEKVKLLEETRIQKAAEFKAAIAETENEFRLMKDHYTSINKLLSSKINTLEEFRMQRELLMSKFETQEELMKEQEMRHKRIIYDTEKKMTINKDNLKKEMEKRLMELAQDFQDATELRIAASTHRVIRENIAINHEMNSMLAHQATLSNISRTCEKVRTEALIAKEVANKERDDVVKKNVTLQNLVKKLTTIIQNFKDEIAQKQNIQDCLEMTKEENEIISKNNFYLNMQIRELQDKMDRQLEDQTNSYANISKLFFENLKLKKIVREVAAAATAGALNLDGLCRDPVQRTQCQQKMFDHILNIISQRHDLDKTSVDISESNLNYYALKKEYDYDKNYKNSVLQPIKTCEEYECNDDSVQSNQHFSSIHSSITTCPSLKMLPMSSKLELISEDSIPSFYRSFHSSDTSEQTDKDFKGLNEIHQKLVESQLEIKKSLMLDLQQSGFKKSFIKPSQQSLIENSNKSNTKINKNIEVPNKNNTEVITNIEESNKNYTEIITNVEEQPVNDEKLSDDIEIESQIHNLDLHVDVTHSDENEQNEKLEE